MPPHDQMTESVSGDWVFLALVTCGLLLCGELLKKLFSLMVCSVRGGCSSSVTSSPIRVDLTVGARGTWHVESQAEENSVRLRISEQSCTLLAQPPVEGCWKGSSGQSMEAPIDAQGAGFEEMFLVPQVQNLIKHKPVSGGSDLWCEVIVRPGWSIHVREHKKARIRPYQPQCAEANHKALCAWRMTVAWVQSGKTNSEGTLSTPVIQVDSSMHLKHFANYWIGYSLFVAYEQAKQATGSS